MAYPALCLDLITNIQKLKRAARFTGRTFWFLYVERDEA